MRQLVVVYDGGCGICRLGARLIGCLDWFGLCLRVPLQSEALYRNLPMLDPTACLQALHAVLPGGRVRVGGDAVRSVLARLPLGAPLALLLAIPPLPQVVRGAYPWLAARRRGMSAACRR